MNVGLDSQLRSFYFSCMATTGDLSRLESDGQVKLLAKDEEIKNSLADYFEDRIFREATDMAQHYMTFYCLERSA